jgi:cation diffusion facilitator CzcD-associated flavoprotein CzcO
MSCSDGRWCTRADALLGAVLSVGTGQSGGQIAEELLAVGREIHLAVSSSRKHRAGTAAGTSTIG